jgi:hypothetical protein
MACHFNGFSANIAYMLPSCKFDPSYAGIINDFWCESIDKRTMDLTICHSMASKTIPIHNNRGSYFINTIIILLT